METEFLTIHQKSALLIMADKESATLLIQEIQRLESIIKDYELGIRMLNDRFESKAFKYPTREI
jgi:hypothetical protein